MRDAFTVSHCTDAARAAELLALAHGAFGELAIDPPSSVLKETAADFATRLQSEICLAIEDNGRIIASVFTHERPAAAAPVDMIDYLSPREARGLEAAAQSGASQMGRNVNAIIVISEHDTIASRNPHSTEWINFAI